MMAGGVMDSQKNRPLYNATGPWANKPPADSVRNGYRYMLDGSDGWYGTFVAYSGYWWPAGGRLTLWDPGNLSLYTYGSTTEGLVAGLPSPVYPWSYLLNVPGAYLRGRISAQVTAPAGTQNRLLRLLWNAADATTMIALRNSNAVANTWYATGETAYRATPGTHQVSVSNTSAWAQLGLNASTATTTDAAIGVRATCGGAGETIVLQTGSVEYFAGVYA
jgi:hypothetical protein